MSTAAPTAAASRRATRLRDGLVVVLALTTGAVNAVAFLRLGKVFASVMTGNLALFGVAAAQRDGEFAISGGLAIAGYGLGVLAGAALARAPQEGQPTWPRRVTVTLALELVVLAGFSGGWLAVAGRPSGGGQMVLLVVVSAAMGLQATAVRRLGQMSSTYLTSTLTSLFEALSARRLPPSWPRSSGTVCALVAGAVGGGVAAVQAPAAVPAAVMVPLAVVLALSPRFAPIRCPGHRRRCRSSSGRR
ncbi:MAG TPA: YoaK family protein [Trebonia sp.]|nr:YoaK family protein [Trebonia sp.]